VIIGFDARHGSRRFADDTAAVLSGAGLRPEVFADPVPTPVLAHFTRTFDDIVAGVMVTASHNPPRDNGYKVYWSDGAQIVPPQDSEISAAIDAVGRVDELPLGSGWPVHDDTELYLAAVSSLRLGGDRDISIVYTPMHGVGRDVLLTAFDRAGFPAPIVVPEQADPDPDFPTVAFPNPEEPGALDLALALAEARGADLVIANDPDADRCAVAVPSPSGWRTLTGDEVGGLLAEHVLRHTTGDDRLVVTTIVSSSLLRSIAATHRVRFAESLTGFKWIMKAGDPSGRTGGRGGSSSHRAPDRLVFGYEEALGYSVGDDRGVLVNDKDGIGAALAVAALAADAKRDGRTLLDLLDAQARKYGLHATSQLSIRVDDLSLITAAMARLRAAPPQDLGGRPVEAFDDLSRPSGGLPPTDGLRFRLAGSTRVVIRPSRTEPNLKCYLEVVLPVEDEDIAALRTRAAAELDALRQALSAVLA
jgi:phosphomannomutase